MNSDAFKTDSIIECHPTMEEKLATMQSRMVNICHLLIRDSKEFNATLAASEISKYITEYDRILYHVITNFIYSLPSGQKGVFETNLYKLVECVMAGSQYDVETQKLILKIWDHTNLAMRQLDALGIDEDNFSRFFYAKVPEIRESMDAQLSSHQKEVTSQLVSLVGIFTAISFLIFGGISSLGNIFNNEIPLLRLLIMSSLWGLCFANLFFVFIYYVAKIGRTHIEANGSHYYGSTTQLYSFKIRYPVMYYLNLILVNSFTICIWYYLVGIDKLKLFIRMFDGFAIHHQIDWTLVFELFIIPLAFILITFTAAHFLNTFNSIYQYKLRPRIRRLIVYPIFNYLKTKYYKTFRKQDI